MSELLSYGNILADIKRFKNAGGARISGSNDFNLFDTPSHKYFKILFYFGSVPEAFATDSPSGLLAPTWEEFNNQNIKAEDQDKTKTDYYNYNSAWAYLKLNNEEERAEKLEQFVTLLSDINSNSPWYFQSISGIDSAIERKSAEEDKLDVSEKKKLSITCLPDAYDNRIGTLLDLYRDVTWSWTHKKEIIPANLRKFDMAVYMFESPTNYVHKYTDTIGSDNGYKVSYKMLEFHDCEFSYNSVKTGWGEINNEAGFTPKYTIEISYADCYEISYNDIMMRKIGDVILTDLLNSAHDSKYESFPQEDDERFAYELYNRTWPKFIVSEGSNENEHVILPNIENSPTITKDTDNNLGARTGTATEHTPDTNSDAAAISSDSNLAARTNFTTEQAEQAAKAATESNANAINPESNLAARTNTNAAGPTTDEISEVASMFGSNASMTFGSLAARNGSATGDITDNMRFDYNPGFLATAAGQVAGHFIKDVKSLYNRAVLGNIYTYSLTKIKDDVSTFLKGDIMAGKTVAQYLKDLENMKIPDDSVSATQKPSGNIAKDSSSTTKLKPKGNIFSKKTLAKNI
jgi:hypothetical protein